MGTGGKGRVTNRDRKISKPRVTGAGEGGQGGENALGRVKSRRKGAQRGRCVPAVRDRKDPEVAAGH